MSTTIDEKVVEMRFDNRQFEAGVKTSLSTLDKLKEGLDLDGAARQRNGAPCSAHLQFQRRTYRGNRTAG